MSQQEQNLRDNLDVVEKQLAATDANYAVATANYNRQKNALTNQKNQVVAALASLNPPSPPTN